MVVLIATVSKVTVAPTVAVTRMDSEGCVSVRPDGPAKTVTSPDLVSFFT